MTAIEAAVLVFAVGLGILFLSLGGFSLSGIATNATKLIAQAIATAEGFYVSGSIPQTANNPGDIADNGVTQWTGDTGQRITSANGAQIIVFDNITDGWNALYGLIGAILAGEGSYSGASTLQQIGEIYSGGSQAWVNNVASTLGISPSTNLSQWASSVSSTTGVSS